MVDGVDDLQVTRQDPPDHVSRPTLQRLGQDGVVRVGAALRRDLPSLENKNGFKIISSCNIYLNIMGQLFFLSLN